MSWKLQKLVEMICRIVVAVFIWYHRIFLTWFVKARVKENKVVFPFFWWTQRKQGYSLRTWFTNIADGRWLSLSVMATLQSPRLWQYNIVIVWPWGVTMRAISTFSESVLYLNGHAMHGIPFYFFSNLGVYINPDRYTISIGTTWKLQPKL